MFKGKKVLLAVTGSIAAYKSAHLARLLVKQGAEVRVILTPASLDFVTPLTLATLSKNPVLHEFVSNKESGEWNNHVELGVWADMMIVAPCSANTLAKMARGECDNLVMAVYLSAKCPVYVAPAMDLDMYKHPTTKANLVKLESFGNHIIEATTGELASGLHGQGRMAEPEEIIDFIITDLTKELPLAGKTVLITAGPTFEPIDPVRFIGNRSSGKMGYALAEEAANQGARVQLVSGPTALTTENSLITTYPVQTASQMFEQCSALFEHCDIAIMAAAVADYAPRHTAESKIKKTDDEMNLELVRTTDILGTLAAKKKKQFVVGFALETDNELENAGLKLQSKNLDLIVLNSLRDEGAGFAHDTNKISILDRNNKLTSFELKTKAEVAQDIINYIITLNS